MKTLPIAAVAAIPMLSVTSALAGWHETTVQLAFPSLVAWAEATFLTLAGFANLSRLRLVRETYADWDIPEGFYRAIGLLQILAAAFLASPEMRVYGILIAAPILFGSVVMLLDHQRYAVAVAVALMMAGLAVATIGASS
jgi:hypothetical protein